MTGENRNHAHRIDNFSHCCPSRNVAQPEIIRADLSVRLFAPGRTDEALRVIEESVDYYRGLAASYPSRHNPGLANARTLQSAWLATVDQFEHATVCANEAVGLYRNLAEIDPSGFVSELRRSN